MPAQVYYQIPIATDPIRTVVGVFCLICVVAIFGSWLPRVVRWLLQLRRAGSAQSMAAMALVLVPLGTGCRASVVHVDIQRWTHDGARQSWRIRFRFIAQVTR